MVSLFIIGNGFDRAHGLETDYIAFREFLVRWTRADNSDEIRKDLISTIKKIIAHLNKKKILSANILETLPADVIEHRLMTTQPILEDIAKIYNWAKFGTSDFNEIILHSSYTMKIIESIIPTKVSFSRDFVLSNSDRIIKAVIKFNKKILFADTNLDVEAYFHDVFVESSTLLPPKLGASIVIDLIDETTGGNWSDFERALGHISFDNFIKLFPIGEDVWGETNDKERLLILRQLATNIFPSIKILFFLWVQEINITSVSPKGGFANLIKRGDRFFSANYTRTLETVYHVDDVCHIHGAIDYGAFDLLHHNEVFNQLIVGHGSNALDIFNESEQKYSTHSIMNGFINNILKKPVTKCIETYLTFFNSLCNIDSIYSFGFSFSDVDMPYVSKICNCIGDTSNIVWYLNKFNFEEHEIFKRKIVANGFNGLFDTFHID